MEIIRIVRMSFNPDHVTDFLAMFAERYPLIRHFEGCSSLRLMQDGGFRHVPLVRDGVLVGVVSRGDFRAMQHARLNDETGLWECMR